jgi:hypothetical protein
MKIRRALLICFAAACLSLAGLAGGVLPASAEDHTYTVTLVNGNTMPLTLDVAPGTQLKDVALPADIADFIYSVSDGTQTVLAKDLKRLAPDKNNSAGDASPGTGGDISKSKAHANGSGAESKAGTGKQLAPSAAALKKAKTHQSDGSPDPNNPTYSFALPGPAPIGVPNFFIDRFKIPPFLLPIYQAAGIEYGVRWEVLAAINEIETDYGRNLNVSSAGAVGWMQFIPSSWKQYGVDANNDGKKDPYNPVDAIFAAARYLRAAGAEHSIKKAIYAYNHADWYVDSVLLRAKLIAGLPADLVGSLTGLTQGRFPVDAKSTYAGAITAADASKRVKKGENAARTVGGKSGRKTVRIFAARGSRVIAVHDGKVLQIGESEKRGRFIRLRDVFGNTYTYAHLGLIAPTHEVRAAEHPSKADLKSESALPHRDPAPTGSASGGSKTTARTAPTDKRRLFAHPDAAASGDSPAVGSTGGSGQTPAEVTTEPLKAGSTVTAGTPLGKIGKTTHLAPHLEFSIKPAGRGAPRIDPKPILDGWKLLETTAIYRAADKNPFVGDDAAKPTIGQILLMSKETLSQRVLNDPRIDIYACGRRDIDAGIIDRRVLATLEFLANSGFEPSVSSLRCGHGRLTAGGRVSYHSSGNAVDISAINGTPILGHQGPGTITDQTVRKLLTLQGAMRPDEIITLAKYAGADNTFALPDHYNHIHVGFRPLSDPKLSKTLNAALKPGQWSRLMDRLNQIDNPTVRVRPSEFAITATKPSSKKSASKAD